MAKGKPFEKIVTVERISKAGTGIFAAGTWFNFGKKSGLSGEDTPIGSSFVISGEESEWQGKPSYFINSVAPHGATAPTASAAAPTSKAPASSKSAPEASLDKAGPVAFGRLLSPYELEKDVRISVAGVIQSVVGSPSLTMLLGGAKSFAQVVDEETRATLAVMDKIVEERRPK